MFLSMNSTLANWVSKVSSRLKLVDPPTVLQKIYIYGYLNSIQSGRRLEREHSATLN